ncbi:hypothetical protein EHM92_00130 [bacterium]|nr:MAG: hypothetical protein EHM92_00130 [bacterium]
MNNRDAVISELKRIADEHEGKLLPGDIVDEARNTRSPLHSKFEWDDTEAAERYRLWQARQLISVTVDYIGADKDSPLSRVFVSLTPDRKDGGYRTIESVMSDKGYRQRLLDDAMEEMQRFQQKFATLKELAEVFAAMRRARKRKSEAA